MNAPAANLEMLMDMPVNLSVELGSCQMPMRDVLQLKAGSVLQLDQVADTPVDLLVNRKLVARGQVVVIDDRFGLKILEVVNGGGK